MENIYQKFEEQLKQSRGDRLLLHACCCPCSSHCLEVLAGHFDITIYFYNPNIDTEEEYEKRFAELVRFTKEAPFAKDVKLVKAPFLPEEFRKIARGREQEPERGSRCYDCYKLRLRSTAEYARAGGYDCFSTTLSISPYKNADWLNEIGLEMEREMEGPYFLFSDFKKKNGYKRSIELSTEYGLYRQDYCGCRYSREERDRKKALKEAKDRIAGGVHT